MVSALFYISGMPFRDMPVEERRAWTMLVVSAVVYLGYLAVILARANGASLTEVSYETTMLWSIGVAIVVNILVNLVIAAPAGGDKPDQRDREINRFGEHIGQSFLVIGGVAGLLLALAEEDYFWIANVICLTFFLSAVFGSVAKLFAYRRGFQSW
jgi:hypothetical protein